MLISPDGIPIKFFFDKCPFIGQVFRLQGSLKFGCKDAPFPFPTTSNTYVPTFKWVEEVALSDDDEIRYYLVVGLNKWKGRDQEIIEAQFLIEVNLKERKLGDNLLLLDARATTFEEGTPQFYYETSLPFQIGIFVTFPDGNVVTSEFSELRSESKR